MAKQIGLYSVRGKVDGYKYYGMKGVANTIIAKINEGMSSRVKNSAEYANTRLNNAEFGAAGNMAGTLVRALTQRWRCITIPFTTAKLLPSIKKTMGLDTTNPWGQRTLTGTTWQDGLRDRIGALAKVDFNEELGLTCAARQDANKKVIVSLEGEIAQATALAGKGIAGVEFDLHVVSISAPAFDSNLNGYAPAELNDFGSGNVDVTIDESVLASETINAGVSLPDASGVMTAVIIVAKPYRLVSGEKYFAQEYCSHKMVAIAQPA